MAYIISCGMIEAVSECCQTLIRHFETEKWVGLPPCFLSSYLAEFANLPYKHHKYAIHPPILVCLNWSVSITVPDIDMRFSSNDTSECCQTLIRHFETEKCH
jgi:hypothetical protein